MDYFDYDLNPVDHIIADAIGEPGKRLFFIQGSAGRQRITLAIEKQEIAHLASGILQLLEELEEKFPDLPEELEDYPELKPKLPVVPDLRALQLILGYNEDDDTIWLIAKALILDEDGEIVDPRGGEIPTVRFVASRDQMYAMSQHALEIVEQGRPECPLCGRPIDRTGHFCPRSDGHAKPIFF